MEISFRGGGSKPKIEISIFFLPLSLARIGMPLPAQWGRVWQKDFNFCSVNQANISYFVFQVFRDASFWINEDTTQTETERTCFTLFIWTKPNNVERNLQKPEPEDPKWRSFKLNNIQADTMDAETMTAVIILQVPILDQNSDHKARRNWWKSLTMIKSLKRECSDIKVDSKGAFAGLTWLCFSCTVKTVSTSDVQLRLPYK